MRHSGFMRRLARAVLSGLAVISIVVAALAVSGASGVGRAASVPPPCAPPGPTPTPPGSTTITTIEQAYYCVFANYYSGPVLDDRVLLAGAFAGLTQELEQLGIDQPDATMPALAGSRVSDWAAFAAVYQQVLSQARPTAAQQQELAAATMNGMIASLGDNHAHWAYPQTPPGARPGQEYDLGLITSPSVLLAASAPAEALPPLYVTAVRPFSPAASAGIRPGDVIGSVNDSPPFASGVLSPGAVSPLLLNSYPLPAHVTLGLQRPVTGRTWTVTLAPALYDGPPPAVSARLLDGHIAYVTFPEFFPGAAAQVLNAIASMAKQAALHGVIVDLRGNTGFSGDEASKLLGAFEHGQPYDYNCDVRGSCTPSYPDASTRCCTCRWSC